MREVFGGSVACEQLVESDGAKADAALSKKVPARLMVKLEGVIAHYSRVIKLSVLKITRATMTSAAASWSGSSPIGY